MSDSDIHVRLRRLAHAAALKILRTPNWATDAEDCVESALLEWMQDGPIDQPPDAFVTAAATAWARRLNGEARKLVGGDAAMALMDSAAHSRPPRRLPPPNQSRAKPGPRPRPEYSVALSTLKSRYDDCRTVFQSRLQDAQDAQDAGFRLAQFQPFVLREALQAVEQAAAAYFVHLMIDERNAQERGWRWTGVLSSGTATVELDGRTYRVETNDARRFARFMDVWWRFFEPDRRPHVPRWRIIGFLHEFGRILHPRVDGRAAALARRLRIPRRAVDSAIVRYWRWTSPRNVSRRR